MFLCQDTLSLRISQNGFRMHLLGARKRCLLQNSSVSLKKMGMLVSLMSFWDRNAFHSHSRLGRDHEFQGKEDEEKRRKVRGRMGL